jgi:hypothetical protein
LHAIFHETFLIQKGRALVLQCLKKVVFLLPDAKQTVNFQDFGAIFLESPPKRHFATKMCPILNDCNSGLKKSLVNAAMDSEKVRNCFAVLSFFNYKLRRTLILIRRQLEGNHRITLGNTIKPNGVFKQFFI